MGSDEEADIVRWIFQQFVVERQSYTAIARQLDHGGILNQSGSLWTAANVHTILRNENYVGNLVYNRTSRRLGQKLVTNPSDQWVRRDAVIDPFVERSLFTVLRRSWLSDALKSPRMRCCSGSACSSIAKENSIPA